MGVRQMASYLNSQMSNVFPPKCLSSAWWLGIQQLWGWARDPFFWGAHTVTPRNVAVLTQAGSHSQARATCGILGTA